MTTIAGVVLDNGDIVIASDSRTCEQETGRYWDSVRTEKIAIKSNLIIGVAGDRGAMDKILHTWDPPVNEGDALDAHTFVTSVVRPSLAEFTDDDDGEWRALIGFESLLFDVSATDAAHDGVHRFAAIGSGAAYALGHLTRCPLSFEANARTAIEVASEFDMFTGGRVVWRTLKC